MKRLFLYLMFVSLSVEVFGQNEPDSIMEVTLPELVFTEPDQAQA